jgi:hypothetical protein
VKRNRAMDARVSVGRGEIFIVGESDPEVFSAPKVPRSERRQGVKDKFKFVPVLN